MNAEQAASKAMEQIDEIGDPANLSKQDWIEMLEIIVGECQSRAEAAREELADD
jgi:hypothetical protein